MENTTDEIFKKAISLRFSECYGAMAIVNAMCGEQTPVWQLIHSHSAKELIDECINRKIDYENLFVAIPKTQLVKDARWYKKFLRESPIINNHQ